MISALASTIDAFMGQYTSPEEAPIAKALCKQVIEALTSTLSPSQGTTPRTTPNANNSESPYHRLRNNQFNPVTLLDPLTYLGRA
ncbi:hypothetical protein PtrEW7m1_011834 [Pyrenophora tritici-repentis]|nr:hypothetical protein PtrEW7m1_011834 [Pyrenophora tritici-repentis]